MMTTKLFIAQVFPYVVIGFFLLGTAWRLIRWQRLPVHVKWTLYPVPAGWAAQLKFMIREILTFGTLYRFNRHLWAGTYILHLAMGGFVLSIFLTLTGLTSAWPVEACLWALLLAAIYIICLRFYDRPLRAVSTGEEYFNLSFLAIVAITGLLATPASDGLAFLYYFSGLIRFRPDILFLSWNHFPFLVAGGLFLIYLPWSKMIHYVAKYFTYHRVNWEKHE